MSLAFAAPEVYDPDKVVAVDTWIRRMTNYLSTIKDTTDKDKFEYVFDRLSGPVQYWLEKTHLPTLKATRSTFTPDTVYRALTEKYGTRDLYMARDPFWNLRYDDVPDLINKFTHLARGSTLPQDELVYIFAARLPHSLQTELRKSPTIVNLIDAIALVQRLQGANRSGSREHKDSGKSPVKGDNKGDSRGDNKGDRHDGKSGSHQLSAIMLSTNDVNPLMVRLNGDNSRCLIDKAVDDNLIGWAQVRRNRIKYVNEYATVTLPDGSTTT